MPIYEYKCTVCNKVTEELRRIAEINNPISCKICGVVAHLIPSSFSVPNYQSTENDDIGKKRSDQSIEDCNFRSCKIGVSVTKGTSLKMKQNRFNDVQTPVEFRDE